MTLAEFKAWFEGFTEGIAVPTDKQWARIKQRVSEIDGVPITERVFIDRYWPPIWNAYPPPGGWWPPPPGGWWPPPPVPVWSILEPPSGGTWQCNNTVDLNNLPPSPSWNSANAMLALGQHEATTQ